MPDDADPAEIFASRREFVLGTVSGALALGLGGGLSPAGLALAEGKPATRLRVLDAHEAATYDAWCDVLAPGAAKVGVSRFVDQQLAAPQPESLLLLRLLDNPPLTWFYREGIKGVDEESTARFEKGFLALTGKQRHAIVDAAATKSTRRWKEPDPDFFYFISRADAVDVVWGTMEGFAKLQIPYLAHIPPLSAW